MTGDIGWQGGSITGFGSTLDSTGEFATSALVSGKLYAADYATPTPAMMTAAISHMEIAYTDAAARVEYLTLTLILTPSPDPSPNPNPDLNPNPNQARVDPDTVELGAGNVNGMSLPLPVPLSLPLPLALPLPLPLALTLTLTLTRHVAVGRLA